MPNKSFLDSIDAGFLEWGSFCKWKKVDLKSRNYSLQRLPLRRQQYQDFRKDTKSGGHVLKAAEMTKSQVSLLFPSLLSWFLEVYKNVYKENNVYRHIVAGRHVLGFGDRMIQSSHQEGKYMCVSCKVLIIRTLPHKQQDPELSCKLSCGNTGNHHRRIKTCCKIYFVDMEEAHVFLEISKYFLTLSVKKCLWWVYLFHFSCLECGPCEQSSN